jgi:prepilin-type N-terminal cleavage/methylation domain-containing protein
MRLRHSKQAFTFIELLITVAIMALTITLATVNYFRSLHKQELYQAASQVEAMLVDAAEKIKNGYLGENGTYCNQLDDVLVTAVSNNGQVLWREQLSCGNAQLITVQEFTLDEAYTIDALPLALSYSSTGLKIRVSGVNQDALTFTLTSGNTNNSVEFILDRSGALQRSYQ